MEHQIFLEKDSDCIDGKIVEAVFIRLRKGNDICNALALLHGFTCQVQVIERATNGIAILQNTNQIGQDADMVARDTGHFTKIGFKLRLLRILSCVRTPEKEKTS